MYTSKSVKLFCSCDVDSVCWFSFDLFLKCAHGQMTSAPKQPVLSPGCDPANNMPGKLTPYLIHPQKIRNTAKTVILWNIITIAIKCFLFPFMYFSRNLILWCKAEFSASLLQSLVSRDPSEIIQSFRNYDTLPWPAAISPCSPRLAHWSKAGLSLVSTRMGDLLGKLGCCW